MKSLVTILLYAAALLAPSLALSACGGDDGSQAEPVNDVVYDVSDGGIEQAQLLPAPDNGNGDPEPAPPIPPMQSPVQPPAAGNPPSTGSPVTRDDLLTPPDNGTGDPEPATLPPN